MEKPFGNYYSNTSANWTSDNSILREGDIGIESDTGKWKLGNGTTAWTSLGYLNGPPGGGGATWGGITGTLSSQTDLQSALDAKQASDAQLTSLAALSYSSNSLKVVRVNAGETDFELATISGGGLEQYQVRRMIRR